MIVKKNVCNDGRLFLSVCDSDLLGKKFEEKEFQLDLSSPFFNGNEKDRDEIIALLKKAYMVNFVGEKSVELGLKEKLIEKENIMRIENIPTALMLVIK